MSAKRGYLWEIMFLLGLSATVILLLNPDFWNAAFQVITGVAAVAAALGVGVIIGYALWKCYLAIFRPKFTKGPH